MRKSIILGAVISTLISFSAAYAADIAVIGGRPNDIFWGKIKKGIDDASHMVVVNGGTVNYLQLNTYDNLGYDTASLIHTAIGQNVDGLAVPNWLPEAEDEAIKAAVAAGIKVIIMDAGTLEKADELGAINYIGSDPYIGGKSSAEYFIKNGQKNVLCVNTLPGLANLEALCQGIKDGMEGLGGKSGQLPLPASSVGDQTAVAEAVKATLLRDGSIDGIVTISALDADAAAIGIAQAGKGETVMLGSLNFSESAGMRIRQGTQLFAIDMQPALQSFLAVTLLAYYIDYGIEMPMRPLVTGPLIVDVSNVEAAFAGVGKGAR